MTTPVHQALALGQSIWYDGIRRSLLTSGELEQMVKKQGLRGMTSNPSIFDAAIAGSSDYSDAIAELRRSGPTDAKSAYEYLAIADIRAAADIFRPVYDESGGEDGYVSMEVSPELAHDTSATVAEAKRLWGAVDRPNLMVKVPGTEAGIPAIQALIGAGINVNVTLLFGLAAYESAAQAYMAGLEDRLAAGAGVAGIASVASIFVSRLDSAVEPHLDLAYAGKVAIANAKVIYEISRKLFSGKRWNALAEQGARSQRLLWASTSTKNPALPELLYVEALMGPDTVDTVPPATFEAFAAHGTVRPALEEDLDGAHAVLDSLSGHGVELSEVLDQLVAEAVEKFATAFRDLLSSVERALGGDVERAEPWRLRTSLPRELTDQVDGVIDEWRSTAKVARIWAHDATVWTGKGEDAWLGWLGVALDQAAHGHRFDALVEEVRAARFADAVVLGMGGVEPLPRPARPHLPPRDGSTPAPRARFDRP